MAAMSAVKKAILSLSKSSEMAQSLTLRPTVSRICFAGASRYQQERNMASEGGTREYSPYNADESVDEPRDEVRETMDRAKESSDDTADAVKERAQQMNDKTKENLGSMADKAYEMRDKTVDTAGNMADKTKRQAHEASDKFKGAAETAADKTTEYAQGAKETTMSAAEKVADAAKETVVGKPDDDDLDDHVKKPARMDEDVVDARRRRTDEHDRDKL